MNFLEKTYVEAIREAIYEELETNKNFVLLGQDIGEMRGVWGQTKDLQKRFGEMRVIDTHGWNPWYYRSHSATVYSS